MAHEGGFSRLLLALLGAGGNPEVMLTTQPSCRIIAEPLPDAVARTDQPAQARPTTPKLPTTPPPETTRSA
jgi:hypothetical protein